MPQTSLTVAASSNSADSITNSPSSRRRTLGSLYSKTLASSCRSYGSPINPTLQCTAGYRSLKEGRDRHDRSGNDDGFYLLAFGVPVDREPGQAKGHPPPEISVIGCHGCFGHDDLLHLVRYKNGLQEVRAVAQRPRFSMEPSGEPKPGRRIGLLTYALRVRKRTGNDGRQPEGTGRYPWLSQLGRKNPETGRSRVVGQFVGQDRFIPKMTFNTSSCWDLLQGLKCGHQARLSEYQTRLPIRSPFISPDSLRIPQNPYGWEMTGTCCEGGRRGLARYAEDRGSRRQRTQ